MSTNLVGTTPMDTGLITIIALPLRQKPKYGLTDLAIQRDINLPPALARLRTICDKMIDLFRLIRAMNLLGPATGPAMFGQQQHPAGALIQPGAEMQPPILVQGQPLHHPIHPRSWPVTVQASRLIYRQPIIILIKQRRW